MTKSSQETPTLEQLIDRTDALIDECDQAIVDAESWADNHPKERPLDVEWFRVMRFLLQRHRRELTRRRRELTRRRREPS